MPTPGRHLGDRCADSVGVTWNSAVSEPERLDDAALGLTNALDRLSRERDVARLVARERNLHNENTGTVGQCREQR